MAFLEMNIYTFLLCLFLLPLFIKAALFLLVLIFGALLAILAVVVKCFDQ